GGTMAAACNLVERLRGRIVGLAFVIELCFLNPREKLGGYDVHTLIQVAGE
ncbi:MAG TPA: adenine phosphoribosyltransferase, partial [Phycisphaerae bacterium]|nr:adenine phosphoribosyltransferase [Phycisphaerae bacterium]